MRCVFPVLAVLTIFFLADGAVQAQTPGQPATCADWFAVQSWTGTVTYSGSGSGSNQNGSSETISESARIDFTTEKNSSGCNVNGDFSNGAGWGWTSPLAKTTYSVTLHDVFTSQQRDSKGNPCTGTINTDVTGGTSSIAAAQVNMKFASATSGTYTVGATQSVDGVTESI